MSYTKIINKASINYAQPTFLSTDRYIPHLRALMTDLLNVTVCPEIDIQ